MTLTITIRQFRICPGKELADASIYIAIAQVLAVFNIGKAKDASGNTVEPLYEYTPGVIRCVQLPTFFLSITRSGSRLLMNSAFS